MGIQWDTHIVSWWDNLQNTRWGYTYSKSVGIIFKIQDGDIHIVSRWDNLLQDGDTHIVSPWDNLQNIRWGYTQDSPEPRDA